MIRVRVLQCETDTPCLYNYSLLSLTRFPPVLCAFLLSLWCVRFNIITSTVTMERRNVLLSLTLDQFEAVKHFINYHDWDLESTVVENGWGAEKIGEGDPGQPDISTPANIGHEESYDLVRPGLANECEFCFCNPCVAELRQSWLGNGARPHLRNSQIRKKRYRKFWTMLSSRGAWRHPKYTEKKTQILASHHHRDLGEIYTLREIMPDCVLSLVRGLYPNPPDQPYMGHRW